MHILSGLIEQYCQDLDWTYLLLEEESSKVLDQSVLVLTLVVFITSNSFSHRFDPDEGCFRSNPSNPDEAGFRSNPSNPEFPESKPELPRLPPPLFPLLRQSSFLKYKKIRNPNKLNKL